MKIVSCTIKDIQPHPNARKLKICQVWDGTQEVTVVCGASNATQNMHTLIAHVGAQTPKNITIQKSDLRGVSSHGMLCSAKDLNLSQETGIITLPEHIPLGTQWTEISPEYLSSIPWFQYKKSEDFLEDQQTKQIVIVRKGEKIPETLKDYKILSTTYFDGEKYLYRHY